MSDFQLSTSFSFRPQQPSLFGDEFKLHLDPQIEAMIRAQQMLGSMGVGATTLPVMPNWRLLPPLSSFYPSSLSPNPNPFTMRFPSAPPSAPLVPRGAGPATPRPGEVGDLLKAIWAVPAVRMSADRLMNQASSQFMSEWGRANNWERGLFIGTSALVAGGTIAGLMSNAETRGRVLGFIYGKDIPVPGVSGLSLHIVERGGGAEFSPTRVPGLTVRGTGAMSGQAGGGLQLNVFVTMDLAQWWRSRR